MDTSEQILVIILSSFLALFLLLAIVTVVQVLRVLKSLRHIVESAEKVVDSAETVGELLRQSAGPLGFFRFVRGVVRTAQRHKPQGKE